MADRESKMQWEPLGRLKKALQSSGLFSAGEVVLARAPGRLDVMGGIADYSGSLVCEMPLKVAAVVAAQGRSDGKVVCRSQQVGRTVQVPVAALMRKGAANDGRDARPTGAETVRRLLGPGGTRKTGYWGSPTGAETVRKLLEGEDKWARYAVGCVWWLLRCGGSDASPNLSPQGERDKSGGVTILVDSDVPLGGGVSSSAAIEVATMTALAGLWGVELEPLRLAVACQEVENRVVGAPCGVMDQVTSCLGQEGAMLEILCQAGADGLPAQVLGPVAVPEGYAFVGVHSGVRHEVSGDPYTDTRVAAFMGQKMLSVVEKPDVTRGHLANVDPRKWKSGLRARLPEWVTGREFLRQYGGTNDPVTTVKPEKTYHVRAATAHHVLEHGRVARSVELLKAAARAPAAQREPFMRRVGRLMVASHHSYGLRAMMGHACTDKLVAMVRRLGPPEGFYGAKITGGGCGGTVAMLMRDDAKARGKLAELRACYEKETGRKTMLFEGTSPGAAALGTMRLTLK